MTAFIDAHRKVYGVEPICRMLPIAPSTYYEMKAREKDPGRLPARTIRDSFLSGELKRVWNENRCVYGYRKMWRQLSMALQFSPVASVEFSPPQLLTSGSSTLISPAFSFSFSL